MTAFARDSGRIPRIDMTPMIDVIFLLVIFWMTVTVVGQNYADYSVRPPASEMAGQPTLPQAAYVLNVPASGNAVRWQGTRMSLAQFEAALRGLWRPVPELVIRADGGVAASAIQRIIKICADAGIERIAFAASLTRPRLRPDKVEP